MIACDAPLPIGELLDWWLGDLEAARADAIEEHFFACEVCTGRLERLREVGAGIIAISREGAIPAATTNTLLNRMSRDHRAVRQYVARPGQVIACSVSFDDDWLVGRLVAELSEVEQVDLEVDTPEGAPIARLEDVTVDRLSGEVVVLFPAKMALSMDTPVMNIRLKDGERVLGEYVFDHTNPDPPG
jgi:hypothetical protein